MNRQRELTDVRPNPGSHADDLAPAKMKSLVRSDIPYRTYHPAALAAPLAVHTQALYGDPPEQRRTRIMVTVPTEAARNYKFVRELVRAGMDCMRINCAHDNAKLWRGMIRNLGRANRELNRRCQIVVDLAGPKLRTGPLEPAPMLCTLLRSDRCGVAIARGFSAGWRLIRTRNAHGSLNADLQWSCHVPCLYSQAQLHACDPRFNAAIVHT
jgi:Pyruvate kinase, barrel domain